MSNICLLESSERRRRQRGQFHVSIICVMVGVLSYILDANGFMSHPVAVSYFSAGNNDAGIGRGAVLIAERTNMALHYSETYEAVTSWATFVVDAYGTSLIDYPLPTKSITAGTLCGISDAIAQQRDPTRSEYNLKRTIRFASKGCLGGLIWTFWYDQLDAFLAFPPNENADFNLNNDNGRTTVTTTSLYAIMMALFSLNTNSPILAFVQGHVSAVTTIISILLEQFIWCPLVYGMFEIPVSTLMNGGSLGSIKKEVDAKLDGLLLSNAKVWTLANLVIYNSPLEWRLFVGNVIDIFWQSIVSDVAADCGKVDDDICEIPNDDDDDYYYDNNYDRSVYEYGSSNELIDVDPVVTMSATKRIRIKTGRTADDIENEFNEIKANNKSTKKDPSFYAEKSRI